MNRSEAYRIYSTAVGYCGLVFRHDAGGVRILRIFLPAAEPTVQQEIAAFCPGAVEEHHEDTEDLARSIQEYFQGKRVAFPMDSLDTSRCGRFQMRVLTAERTIPYGKTASYGWIARRLGMRGGAQAIGQALARNPFPIIIPCHRTIRFDRTIGLFQRRGGLKRRMLELEGVRFDSYGRVAAESYLDLGDGVRGAGQNMQNLVETS